MRRIIVVAVVLTAAALAGLPLRGVTGGSSETARLISTPDLKGWRHSGEGSFDVQTRDGTTIYITRGGMGLLWWKQELNDFEVSFDFKVSRSGGNSGIFLRVPDPTVDTYVYESFEVQVDPRGVGTSATGAIYSVQPPLVPVVPQPGTWYRMVIRASGEEVRVLIDGVLVNVFRARAGGQVESYALEGHLGLQNHSANDVVRFRDIRLTKS